MNDQRDERLVQVALRLPLWLDSEFRERVPSGDRNKWLIAAVEEKLAREKENRRPDDSEQRV